MAPRAADIGYHLARMSAVAPRHSQAQKEDYVEDCDPLYIAARYLVYKLYVPRRALTDLWHLLSTLGEAAVTVGRAVELGSVILRDERAGYAPKSDMQR